jgi:hypothetical protein
LRRARSTERLGLALTVLGWVMVFGGVGLFVYVALRNGWGDWANWRAWLPPAAGGPAWPIAAGGVALLGAGSLLRLLAAMAVALGPRRRDSGLPHKFRLNAGGDVGI